MTIFKKREQSVNLFPSNYAGLFNGRKQLATAGVM